jgi:hypothetical protein
MASTGTRSSGGTFAFTMPQSITNGAGTDDAFGNQYYPIIRVQANGGGVVTAGMTLNTASNFNIFTISGMTGTANQLIRLNF